MVGLGSGSNRPTFTFSTVATANIPVTVANVSIQNLLFKANVADLVSYMTATSTNTPKDFAIDRCEFRDGSSILNALTVFTGNATAASCDGFSLTNSKVYQLGATAATANVTLAAALNSAMILLSTASSVLTRVLIDGNQCVYTGANAATGILVINTSSTDTGVISNNYVSGARAYATAILANASTGLNYYNNFYHVTADLSGAILPAAQT